MSTDTDLAELAGSAYHEGALAFRAGQSAEENPYHSRTDLARSWAAGHYAASPENRKQLDAIGWFDASLRKIHSEARTAIGAGPSDSDFGRLMEAHARAADLASWAMKAKEGRMSWTSAKDMALQAIRPETFVPIRVIETRGEEGRGATIHQLPITRGMK